MEYRNLGRSGLMISEIVCGTWLRDGDFLAADEARACLRAALDAGITTFDTADTYYRGGAEEILGQVLSGVPRSSVEIATKVCLPTGEGPNDRGLSRKHVRESCDASLRRLRTDHIDLYQAHRWDERTPLEETLIAFDDLVRQGKVLYLGVSEWTAPQISRALRLADDLGLRSRIVSNQPQYSMLWRVIEPEVLPLCREAGIGQLAFQSLAQGVLTGKYPPGQTSPAGTRGAAGAHASYFMGRVLGERLLATVQELRPLAEEVGVPMAHLAIAWVLAQPGVSGALVGVTRPEQATENAGASGVRLPQEVLTRIDDTLAALIDRDPTKTGQLMAVRPDWRTTASRAGESGEPGEPGEPESKEGDHKRRVTRHRVPADRATGGDSW